MSSKITLQQASLHMVDQLPLESSISVLSDKISILPDRILGTVFSFATYPEVAQSYHPVCDRWSKIFPVGGHLDLRNSDITNEALEKIINNFAEKRITINSINLSGCKNITNEGLTVLNKLKNLSKLDLSDCTQI